VAKENDTPLTAAQQRLAAENVKLAYNLVYRRARRSAPLRIAVEKLGEDRAVSEAMAALVRAARGFKEELGYKFSTYACNAMIRAVVRAGQTCGRLTERYLNGNFERVPFATQFGGEGDEGFSQESVPGRQEEEEEPLYGPQEVAALREAIAGLPEKWREILARRYWGEESLIRVGEAVGTSKESVRQSQERALARLRKMLVREEEVQP